MLQRVRICFATMVLAVLSATGLYSHLHADVIFKATGNGGDGLLGTNITPPPMNFGSGGLGPGGISLDLDENFLSVDILWGSQNGFDDLTGDVTMLHLHGPTPSEAPDSFNERGPLILNLAMSNNFNPSGTGGGLQDTFFLSNDEVNYLLSGRTYINVHTTENTEFGEIRGYLVSVPEPTALPLLIAGVIWVRWRRQP